MTEVNVYTTNTCPYCVMVKSFLEKNNIKFNEINVENDQDNAIDLVEKTGQMGVPVTVAGNYYVLGYDPTAIIKMIETVKAE